MRWRPVCISLSLYTIHIGEYADQFDWFVGHRWVRDSASNPSGGWFLPLFVPDSLVQPTQQCRESALKALIVAEKLARIFKCRFYIAVETSLVARTYARC